MTDSDILDRARQAQHDCSHATYLQIRLDFLQDLIWEIERLRSVNASLVSVNAPTIGSIREKLEKQQ